MNKKGENFAFSDTFVEITILNYLANCTHFKWIARDQDGCLCIYKDKPHNFGRPKCWASIWHTYLQYW